MAEHLGRVALGTIEVVAAMPRCKDCRHWVRHIPSNGAEGMCTNVDDAYVEALPLARPYVQDKGWLVTPPDFGCVQWQAKPDIIRAP